MVFVEIDRCTTDAIMALTGCRPGKRSMKIRDYGKMAATFINLETSQGSHWFHESRLGPASAIVPAWVEEMLEHFQVR